VLSFLHSPVLDTTADWGSLPALDQGPEEQLGMQG
jgi:hypothetical protein